MGKSTISMAIFHRYVCLPEGIFHKIPLKTIKPPLNHHFPMVFLWFSYGHSQVIRQLRGPKGRRQRGQRGQRLRGHLREMVLQGTQWISMDDSYGSIMVNKPSQNHRISSFVGSILMMFPCFLPLSSGW